MLPTFVIGLREGLEASLIVGIVAAFLKQQGRRDALRWMWAGVVAAVILCTGAAIALQIVDRQLPQRQQEGLETVVALVAVGMVTFMIVWMSRHARGLGSELRASAASALARGSAGALVAMAFFAVVREGLETAVFLLAAFQASGDSTSAAAGALLGILCAVGIGWGIYRGGVRLNLSRFFRITSAALVLVAAGLVMSAIHTAHEATWLNSLQAQTLDLSWLVRPGVDPQLAADRRARPSAASRPSARRPAGSSTRSRCSSTCSGRPHDGFPGAASAVVLVVVVAAVLAGCGSSGSGDKAAAGAKGQTLSLKLTDAGCSPEHLTAKAGAITFDVENGGSGKVSELELKNAKGIILGERENIVAGISGSFTLDLQPGTYVLNCPNGDREDNGSARRHGHADPGRHRGREARCSRRRRPATAPT